MWPVCRWYAAGTLATIAGVLSLFERWGGAFMLSLLLVVIAVLRIGALRGDA